MSDQTLGLVLLFAAIGALVAQPTQSWSATNRQPAYDHGDAARVLPLGDPAGRGLSVPTLMGALFVFGACNGGLMSR